MELLLWMFMNLVNPVYFTVQRLVPCSRLNLSAGATRQTVVVAAV